MYPEVRGHSVFGPEVERGCGNTLDLFSRSDRAWLVLWRWPFPMLCPRCLVELYQACIPAEWVVGRGGDAGGEGKAKDLELLRACLHLQNKEGGWQKDYSGYFFSVEGYMCDVALHCYIRRPAYSHAQKIIVALPPCFCLSFVLLPS